MALINKSVKENMAHRASHHFRYNYQDELVRQNPVKLWQDFGLTNMTKIFI